MNAVVSNWMMLEKSPHACISEMYTERILLSLRITFVRQLKFISIEHSVDKFYKSNYRVHR